MRKQIERMREKEFVGNREGNRGRRVSAGVREIKRGREAEAE